MSYERWLGHVDAELSRRIGFTSGDLPDANLPDWFDEGITPVQAAKLLIAAGP